MHKVASILARFGPLQGAPAADAPQEPASVPRRPDGLPVYVLTADGRHARVLEAVSARGRAARARISVESLRRTPWGHTIDAQELTVPLASLRPATRPEPTVNRW